MNLRKKGYFWMTEGQQNDRAQLVRAQLGAQLGAQLAAQLAQLVLAQLVAQLVPGMTRGEAKPQSGRASRSEPAAKAVRTATKLSHRVTERYGAGY